MEVIGTIRNAFILSDSTIYVGGTDPQLNLNKYNNVVAIRGSWNVDIPLPLDIGAERPACLSGQLQMGLQHHSRDHEYYGSQREIFL